ncbi:MAG: SpoIIE family protein phosphatase [Fibrobacterales bacterium]
MSRILVVDDEPEILASVELILLCAGHTVDTAANGFDALDSIMDASSEKKSYEILITDVQMPGKNGEELVREVVKEHPDLSVIAMTGYGERNIVVGLMKAGCREFVDKPFTDDQILDVVNNILQERSKRGEFFTKAIEEKEREIAGLTDVFSKLKEQVKEAVVSYDEIIALDIDTIPLDISYKVRPLSDIGGDLLAVNERPDGSVAVLVADVAGHDMSASYHAVLMKTLFLKFCNVLESPELFFAGVNDVLVAGDNQRMITAQLVVVDKERRSFSLTTAGHPPILYWSAKNNSITFIESEGDVIGILPNVKFHERIIDCEPGDSVLMYTDGVVELKRTDGLSGRSLMLTPKGLSDLYGNYLTLPMEELVEALWQDALEFSRYKIEDDLLLVGIKFKGSSGNVHNAKK